MKHQISIKEAKGVFFWTNILDTFIDGYIENIDKNISQDTTEMLNLVQTIKRKYILRVVTGKATSKKEIEKVLNEYEYSVDCSKKLPKEIAIPLEIKQHINNDIMSIEMLYEHGETLNPINFGKFNAEKLLSFIIKILEPLCKLEENGIFNLNIDYNNILIDGDQVKILYLGKSGTEKLAFDSKNDVYYFGMILYQLVTGEKHFDELLTNDLDRFLEQKITNDDLRNCFIPILKSSLESKSEKRPTFEELKLLCDSILIKNELNQCKKEVLNCKEELSN